MSQWSKAATDGWVCSPFPCLFGAFPFMSASAPMDKRIADAAPDQGRVTVHSREVSRRRSMHSSRKRANANCPQGPEARASKTRGDFGCPFVFPPDSDRGSPVLRVWPDAAPSMTHPVFIWL